MYWFQLYIYPATSVVNYVEETSGEITEARNPTNGADNISNQHTENSILTHEAIEVEISTEPIRNSSKPVKNLSVINESNIILSQDFVNSTLIGEKDKSVLGEVDKSKE